MFIIIMKGIIIIVIIIMNRIVIINVDLKVNYYELEK